MIINNFFQIYIEYWFFHNYKLFRINNRDRMSIIKNYFKQNSVTHTFSSCQWPIGDPQEKEFHFCEAQTVTGKPYCQSHCDIAYIDEKELKKEKEAQKNRRIAA